MNPLTKKGTQMASKDDVLNTLETQLSDLANAFGEYVEQAFNDKTVVLDGEDEPANPDDKGAKE